MDETQASVDSLVRAVQVEDVLFVLYYLEQLPPGHVDDEDSVTSLSALQTAVSAPSLSRRRRLILHLLLLVGAAPDYYGVLTSARVRAAEAGNGEASSIMDEWHRGRRAEAHDAQLLLRNGSREAEQWITDNDYETDETKRDRQERVAEAAAAAAASAAPIPAPSKDYPAPMELEHPVAQPKTMEVDPSESTAPPSAPPTAPSPSSFDLHRLSPSTKRTITQADLLHDERSTSNSATSALAARPAMGSSFDTDEGDEADGRPSSALVARIASGPTKKLKIDLPLSQGEVSVPVFDPPHLFINGISPKTKAPVLAAALHQRLSSAISLDITSRLQSSPQTTAYIKGATFDVDDVVSQLDGTVVDAHTLRVQRWERRIVNKSSAATPSTPIAEEPAVTEDRQPEVPAPPQVLPSHLAQYYLVINPGPINDAAIKTVCGCAARDIGMSRMKIAVESTTPDFGRSRLLVRLEHPVPSTPFLAELNGKILADHVLEIYRADQAPPPPNPRPTPAKFSSTVPHPLPLKERTVPVASPTTSFTIRNLSKNATSDELEQLFRPVCAAYASPDTAIKASIISSQKGKLIGHVQVAAEVNVSLILELLRERAIRGKRLVIEPGTSTAEGVETPSAASPAPTAVAKPTSVLQPAEKSPPDAARPSTAFCASFYVENLGQAAQPTNVKTAFAQAVDPQLISDVSMTGGGGSAIVSLKEPYSVELMKGKMAAAVINGRKLIISPHVPSAEAVLSPSRPPTQSQQSRSVHHTRPSTLPPRTSSAASSTSSNRIPVAERRPDGAASAATLAHRPLAADQPPSSSPAPPAPGVRRHDWGSDEDEPSPKSVSHPPTAITSSHHDRTASTASSGSTRSATIASTATSLSSSPAAEQRSADLARLATLNFGPDEITLVNRLMQPIATPPSATFDRTAQLEAIFGYVKPEEARLALQAQSRRRTFAEDEAMQLGYETFLRSQLGDSRDHYTIFFAQLAKFNNENRTFMEAAKEALATARAGRGGVPESQQ